MSRFGKTAGFLETVPATNTTNATSTEGTDHRTSDKSCETSFADATDNNYSACAALKKKLPLSGGGGLGLPSTAKRRVEFSDKCVDYCEEVPNGVGVGSKSSTHAPESDYQVCDKAKAKSGARGHSSCVVKVDAQVEVNAKSEPSCHGQERQNHGHNHNDEDYRYAHAYSTANPVILNARTLASHSYQLESEQKSGHVNLQVFNHNQNSLGRVNVHASRPEVDFEGKQNNSHAHTHNGSETPKHVTGPTDGKKSTFGTLLKPTLTQAHEQVTVTRVLPQQQNQQQLQREERQRQWEAELDLIVPANEHDYSGTTTSGDSSTLTSQQTVTDDQQQQEFASSLEESYPKKNPAAAGTGIVSDARRALPPTPRRGIPIHPAAPQPHSQPLQNKSSRIILVPDTSSFIPDSRTGSSVHLPQHQQHGLPHSHSHQYFQYSPSSTPLSTISTDKSGSIVKRTGFCARFELDVRQICVVCGFLIVAAALGIGVGVPIALQLSTHSTTKKDDWKHDGVVRKLLSEVPLIDGHNDLAWNLRKFLQNQLLEINFDKDLRQFEPFAGSAWSHTDLKRLREGRVGAQLWSTYVPCSAQHLDAVQIAMEQIDVIKRLVDKYQNSLALVRSVKDIEVAHSGNKIGSLIAVEGGHAIGNSLAVLRILYDLGARSLTLTHNCNTPWADSASSDHYLPDRGGLTEFGKLVVLECNRLGLIVDLAHVSVHTMSDALAVSRAPVIFSHSAASSLCNHSRNVPDEIMKLVTANGGLVMVSFYNVFLACNETATMDDVIAHIEHIRSVAGVDHVGLGAGYDGINFVPLGLEDVSKYPDLIQALYERDGWTEQDLKKLIGLNFLRVFRQVEAIRDEWESAAVGPIEEWIPKNELTGHPTLCSSRGMS